MSRALAATAWSGAEIVVRHALQLLVLVVLARLIAPSEFGTVAVLSLFTGIATVFVEAGFSSALIQKQDATQTDESTVFWVNILSGSAAALILCASAPFIRDFFGVSELQPLTLLMALNVLLATLGSIHSTLLVKRLAFRTLLMINGSATVISSALAITLALSGAGVWALAAQALTMTAMTTALLWRFSTWRPTAELSRASARSLFRFGGYLFASGLLEVAYSRGYTVLIGKLYGVRDVGYYNRAVTTQQVPATMITEVLARVAFPAFSSAAEDSDRLQRGLRLAVRSLMLVNVPAMLGLAAVAKPLVITVFGNAWAPAAPLIQMLCLGGLLWPLHVINLNALLAQGHSKAFFRLEVAKKIVGISLLVGGSLFGLLGIAASQAAFSYLAFVLNSYYTKKFLHYGAAAQIRDFLPVLIIATPIAAATAAISTAWNGSPMLELTALGVGSFSCFILVAAVVRPSAVEELLSLLRAQRLRVSVEPT